MQDLRLKLLEDTAMGKASFDETKRCSKKGQKQENGLYQAKNFSESRKKN